MRAFRPPHARHPRPVLRALGERNRPHCAGAAGRCKLSGLVTEASANWSADDLRAYVDHLLALFGPPNEACWRPSSSMTRTTGMPLYSSGKPSAVRRAGAAE